MDPIVRELLSNYLPVAKNYQLDITSKFFPKNTTQPHTMSTLLIPMNPVFIPILLVRAKSELICK